MGPKALFSVEPEVQRPLVVFLSGVGGLEIVLAFVVIRELVHVLVLADILEGIRQDAELLVSDERYDHHLVDIRRIW